MRTSTTAAPAGTPVPIHELQRQLESVTAELPHLELALGEQLRLGQSAAAAEQALLAARTRRDGLKTAIEAAKRAAQTEVERAERERLTAEQERVRLTRLRHGWLGWWEGRASREAQARRWEQQAARLRLTQTAGWPDETAAQAEQELRQAGVALPALPAELPADLAQLEDLVRQLGTLKQLAGNTPADRPLQAWRPPR